jgi:hypothetical protein
MTLGDSYTDVPDGVRALTKTLVSTTTLMRAAARAFQQIYRSLEIKGRELCRGVNLHAYRWTKLPRAVVHRTRPGTSRTLRGAAHQIAMAEMTQHAIAMTNANL